jgi:hypothetical protein
MTSSNLPLLFISLGSSNPYDVANFFRDLASTIETQAEKGELVTQFYRGNSESGCGGTAKIKWSRTAKDDSQFAQFKVLGVPKPYGEIREVCGMTFATEEITTIPSK